MHFRFCCGVCGIQHFKFFDALRCELKGTPDVDDFPPGLMHEYHMHDEFIGIFAIAKSEVHGHYVEGSLFACRPAPRGDNGEGQFCGMDSSRDVKEYQKGHFVTEFGRKQPEYRRMCELLRSKGITPQFYDEHGTLHIGEFYIK